jgi:signal transduction histidine kinase
MACDDKLFMKKFTPRPPVTIAALVSLLVLVAALAVLAKGIRNQSGAFRAVVHTREVLENVQSTIAHASEAEAAQRGLLLTGSPGFLASYRQARDAVPVQVAALRALTRDNPRQQGFLRDFEEAVRLRFDLLERVLQEKQAGRAPTVATLESGLRLKERILALAQQMRAEEQRLLQERQGRVEAGRRELIAAFATTGGMAVALIILLWILSSRDAARLLARAQALAESELALKRRLAQIETIYRAVPVGLGLVDAGQRLAELNDALADAAGRPKEALVGIDLARLLAPLGAQAPAVLDQVLRERRQVGGVEFSTFPGAGPDTAGQRDWLASFYPVVEGDRLEGIVIALLEVTQIKAAQRKLIEANQLLERRVEERTARIAEANAELRAFAHTVAHDLRAPLRNVEGFATALLEDEAERMSADGRLFAERIVAAVVRMDRLITDLLAYSRLSRAELRLERVDLGAVVKTVLRDLEGQIADSGARLDIGYPLPAVRGNATILVQVLANLVSNAIKFVERGVAPQVTITASQDGMAARLLIADNGIGIAPEHREHVFGVFERLHGHERYPGTGIGLAIVKKGLERMGGTVRILDREGGGTLFELTMPAAD